MTPLAVEGSSDPMPWSPIIILSVTLVGSGVLLAWIGNQARLGRLERNTWAGIRTATTMSSDEAWQAAHLAAGWLMVVAGAVSVLGGLALLSRPSNRDGVLVVMGTVGIMQ